MIKGLIAGYLMVGVVVAAVGIVMESDESPSFTLWDWAVVTFIGVLLWPVIIYERVRL